MNTTELMRDLLSALTGPENILSQCRLKRVDLPARRDAMKQARTDLLDTIESCPHYRAIAENLDVLSPEQTAKYEGLVMNAATAYLKYLNPENDKQQALPLRKETINAMEDLHETLTSDAYQISSVDVQEALHQVMAAISGDIIKQLPEPARTRSR